MDQQPSENLLPPPKDEEAPKVPADSAEAKYNLDAMGPLVVNKDGTLSRIKNWPEMTEIERERTMRILIARNQIRRENVEAQRQQEQHQQEQQQG